MAGEDELEKKSEPAESGQERASETAVQAIEQSQGIKGDRTESLASKLNTILSTDSGKQVNENGEKPFEPELVKFGIKTELDKIKPGSPQDKYLQSQSKSEQQAIKEELIKQAGSRSPKAAEALEALASIAKLEAICKLSSPEASAAESKRNTFDGLLTLSSLESANDSKTKKFLDQFFFESSLSFQTELVTARGTAALQDSQREQSTVELLNQVFSGDPKALKKLEGHNFSLLRDGRPDLLKLTHLATDVQSSGIADLQTPFLDKLGRLSQQSPIARELMAELIKGGILKFDPESGKYKSLLGNEFDASALWSVRRGSGNTGFPDGYTVLEKSDQVEQDEQDQDQADDELDFSPAEESEADFRTLVGRVSEAKEKTEGKEEENETDESQEQEPEGKADRKSGKLTLTAEELLTQESDEESAEKAESFEPAELFEPQRILANGIRYEFNENPPYVKSITNDAEKTYAHFDSEGRVLEYQGKDHEKRSFVYEGDKIVAFSDAKGSWKLGKDEEGKDCYINDASKEKFYGELKVNAAVNAMTKDLLVSFSKEDHQKGETTTITPDGSKEVASDDGSSKLFEPGGKLVKMTNLNSGESVHLKWFPDGHPQAGKLAEIKKPDGSVWTRSQTDPSSWVSDKGGKWRGQIDIDAEKGIYHYKGENGNEVFWYANKAEEVLNRNAIHKSAEALYDSLNSRHGVDINRFQKVLEGKSFKERQAIEEEFKKKTGGRSVFNDIGVRLSGSDRLRAVNALRHPSNADVDYAGALSLAFQKYNESYFGGDAMKEMRSFLMSRSSQEMAQIRKEFPERLRMAGLPVKTLDQAIESFPSPDKEACQTLAKGADKLTYWDFKKLSETAMKKGDIDMFLEVWKSAGEENRQAYLDQPDIESKIKQAFPGSIVDRVSKKGLYVDAGKAMDVLKLGYVGADKFIREASTYIYGDFEEHIDAALRNMPEDERKLFVEGEKLAAANPSGEGLFGREKTAYERYKAIHSALEVPGYRYEVLRWEDMASSGGSLIAALAEKKGVIYDSGTDEVMKTIENMSLEDFERLRSEPGYREKVEEVLATFADGSKDDPNSELGRALALIDRKYRVESDTNKMRPEEKEKYERGREIFEAGRLASLSKQESEALDYFGKKGKNADTGKMTADELKLWERGKELASDLEARDFYRQRSFASSQIRTRRSIAEVLDDNERFYGNNVANVFDALSNMRPDEKRLIEMSQELKDGKVDLAKLSDKDRARYEAAAEFRQNLEKRLDGILDRGVQMISSIGDLEKYVPTNPLSHLNPALEFIKSAKHYQDAARSQRFERDTAQSILDRVGRGESGKQDIIDKLNIHASYIQADKAQICRDVMEALKENPQLAKIAGIIAEGRETSTLKERLAALPAQERAIALRLDEALRKSLGSSLYSQWGTKLFDGTFSAADQIHMRTMHNVFDDKLGMLRDLESFSQEQRERLSTYLSDEKTAALMAGKSPDQIAQIKREAELFKSVFEGLTDYEQSIFRNALRNGMKPEDYLHHHFGADLDGTNEQGVKEVFAKLADRNAAREEMKELPQFKGKEISQQMLTDYMNKRLERVFNDYAQKYGENLMSKLVREIGGEDLRISCNLACKQSEDPDAIVFRKQVEFFNSLGLGSDFVDFMGWGASTSLGKNAFDSTIAAQALDRMGLSKFDSERAKELASQLFEASLKMDSTQNELANTTIDIAISLGCILATVPSGGTSLIALGTSIGGKLGTTLKAVGTVLQTMDKAMKLSQGVSRTEFLANWFKNASKAEQMIALGIAGGVGKTGFKAGFVGNYDLATHGFQDFLSGFTDMALNVDIPLGKWSRSAAGRSFTEVSEALAQKSAAQGGESLAKLGKDTFQDNFEESMEKGLTAIADKAMGSAGKVDDKAVEALAESLVKAGIADRDKVVKELAETLQKSLSKNVEQDLRMTQAVLEALYASRQGVLAGGLSSAAYANPDASLEQNAFAVLVGAGAGGTLNLALALPLEMAGKAVSRMAPKPGAHTPAPHATGAGDPGHGAPAHGAGPSQAGHGHGDGQSVKREAAGASADTADSPKGRQAGDDTSPAAKAKALESKSSTSDEANQILSDTDKKVHEVGRLMKTLEANKGKMSAQDIARQEAVIEDLKKEIVSELKSEAENHLVKKLGLTEAEAKKVCENLKIDITDFDPVEGINGVMHQTTGHIEMRMGADFPKGRSSSQTFLHEFEHMINHSRNSMLLQEKPAAAINAIVDDCLKGVLAGGKRLEDVPGAQSAADLVKDRLSSKVFSQQEVDFVKKQLKDYLTEHAAEGKMGKPLSADEFKKWLDTRTPPAKFPDAKNESILMKEMLAEIENANLVLSSAKMTDSAAANPAVQDLMAALKRVSHQDSKAIKHYFNGIADNAVATGWEPGYNFASAEELAANRLPIYRLYDQTGKQAREGILQLADEVAKGAPLSAEGKAFVQELKGLVDQVESSKASFAEARKKAQSELSGPELVKKLKSIDTDERKEIRKLEQKLFDKLNAQGNEHLLVEIMKSRKLNESLSTVFDAVEARARSVEKLRELTAIELFARAARDAKTAGVSGDKAAIAKANEKLDEAVGNLLEKSSDKTLNSAVDYMLRQGIASPEKIMAMIPPGRTKAVVEALCHAGASAKSILSKVKEEQAEIAVEVLLKNNMENDLLYNMIYESPPHLRQALKEVLESPPPGMRNNLEMKIPYLLEQAEKSGKLVSAVKFLEHDAKMSRQAIVENLGPSMEARVKAVFDKTYKPPGYDFVPEDFADLIPAEMAKHPEYVDEMMQALDEVRKRWQQEELISQQEFDLLRNQIQLDNTLQEIGKLVNDGDLAKAKALLNELDPAIKTKLESQNLTDLAVLAERAKSNTALQKIGKLVNDGELDKAKAMLKDLDPELRVAMEKLLRLEKLSKEITEAVNPVFEKMGMPKLEFQALDRADAAMSCQAGSTSVGLRVDSLRDLLKGNNTEFMPKFMHELTHAEQNTLMLRKMKEDLAAEKNLSAERLRTEFQRRTGADPSKELLDHVMKTNYPPLDAAEIRRAEALTESVSQFLQSYKHWRQAAKAKGELNKIAKGAPSGEASDLLKAHFIEKAKDAKFREALLNDPEAPKELKEMLETAIGAPEKLDGARIKDLVGVWEYKSNKRQEGLYDYSVHEREANEVFIDTRGKVEKALIEHPNPDTNQMGKELSEDASKLAQRDVMAAAFDKIADKIAAADWDKLSDLEKSKLLQDALKDALLAQVPPGQAHVFAVIAKNIKIEPGSGEQALIMLKPGESIKGELVVQVPAKLLKSRETAIDAVSKAYAALSVVHQGRPLSTLGGKTYTFAGDKSIMQQEWKVNPEQMELREALANLEPLTAVAAQHSLQKAIKKVTPGGR